MASTYAWMIPYLTEVARSCGYALGIHGSLHRDLDLLAVPWIEEAKSAEELIEAMRAALDGQVLKHGALCGRWDSDKKCFVEAAIENPAHKPHGRLAWNIHLAGGLYLDVSVMPLQAARDFEG